MPYLSRISVYNIENLPIFLPRLLPIYFLITSEVLSAKGKLWEICGKFPILGVYIPNIIYKVPSVGGTQIDLLMSGVYNCAGDLIEAFTVGNFSVQRMLQLSGAGEILSFKVRSCTTYYANWSAWKTISLT